ncbi:hypothetical protein Ahy_A10g049039 [Arachis hypogaea]|uniref:Uncharacterized protein n=1 Tax=Arachis hypogaea TaxID=3818 RepID=A0A445B6F1_ARAHY|nr:hypothetical protein Ahy_A10g049039 [Arachis hypogaea]
MHRKLLDVHIPNLAHLAKRVQQVKVLQKEKEKIKSEKKLKKKVSYVEIESSSEEYDVEFLEVNLAELKKDPPYICSLLKKITSVDKTNDMKYKSEKNYSFGLSKLDQIFDVLLRDKQLVLPEGKTLLSIKDLKEKSYYKIFDYNCIHFRDLIQEAIMKGRLKFDDDKRDMKVEIDPFDDGANFTEPIFLEINMVRFTYEFDTTLGDFETNV